MIFKPVEELNLEPNKVYRAEFEDNICPSDALSLRTGEGAPSFNGEDYELVELVLHSPNPKVGWDTIRRVDPSELAPARLREVGARNPFPAVNQTD